MTIPDTQVENNFVKLCSNPIFAAIHAGLAKFHDCDAIPHLEMINQRLQVPGIHFVPQNPKPMNFEQHYEPRIYLHGEVQTRDNSWHDFFNALVWQQFPQTKKLINTLQYEQQQTHYPDKRRTLIENMLTLFDENGAIVISRNPDLLELIRQHRWHELFWQKRELVKTQLQIFIFGHGLYEKALNPYIGITAQSLLLTSNSTQLDHLVAEFLLNNQLTTQLLHPLPILGIPNWWPDNTNESFYANKNYFRDKNYGNPT